MQCAPKRSDVNPTKGVSIASRWALALTALSLVTTLENADAEPGPRPPIDSSPIDSSQKEAHQRINRLKADRPFWEWVGNPHGRELELILAKVAANRQIAANFALFNYTGAFQLPAFRERARVFSDTLEMLAYARTLAPRNERILIATAEVASDAGKSTLAISSLRRLFGLAASSGRSTEHRFAPQHAMLGALLASRALAGETEQAALHLASAIGNGTPGVVWRAVFVLANLEMSRGRTDAAIDLLINTNDVSNVAPLMLALAVAYDRNDEGTKASVTLASLKRGQAFSGAMLLPYSIEPLQFSDAADRHYYRALFYETSGELALARSEWVAYKFISEALIEALSETSNETTRAVTNVPDRSRTTLNKRPHRFVARAGEHVRDIDRLAGRGRAASKKKPIVKTNKLPSNQSTKRAP